MTGAAAAAKPPLVELQDVSVEAGGRRILSHVDLAIAAGEIVTVVGPNGSGKTTLLRAILGAVRPCQGRVRRAPGLRIGHVPQALHLDPALPLTVSRMLSLPRRVPQAAIDQALAEAGLGDLGDRPLQALSGGQRQRALLARALLADPQLLILDEPTTGLDQSGAAAFYDRIARLRRDRGCAVLMVSHDLHVVMAASDRVICVNGHICCEGHPEVVASAPEYRALFGTGTRGALALYKHDHDHEHGPGQDQSHGHGHGHGAGHGHELGHGHDEGRHHAPVPPDPVRPGTPRGERPGTETPPRAGDAAP